MRDIKDMENTRQLFDYFRQRPLACAGVLAAALGGACLGVVAYFQNWLG